MSVCTTGFIATDFKNPFPLMGLVEQTLQLMLRPHWNAKTARLAMLEKDSTLEFRQPSFSITSPSSGSVQAHFTYKGQSRSLYLHFMCDSDHADVVAGKKVHLSLGDSGMSRPLMRALLQPLSIFGKAFVDDCDSDDKDHEPIFTERKVNLMDLFAAGLVHVSQVAVDEWYEFWKSTPQLKALPLAEFIGLSEEEVLRLAELSSDYDEGKKLINLLLDDYQSYTAPLDLGFSAIDECFEGWVDSRASVASLLPVPELST